MKAMILAAGLGTRLGELTSKLPKVLVDINGRSLLEIILSRLRYHGFDDIIINVHHHADLVEEQCSVLGAKLGVGITISDERDGLLDTGGGLFKARHFFDDKPFLLYNGDILTDLNLGTLYDFHLRKGAAATVATRDREGSRLYLIDKSAQIRGWTNRQSGIDIVTIDEPMELREIASMAITVLDPRVFDYMDEGVYSMTSILIELAGREKVMSFSYDGGYWIDIGSPSMLAKARSMIDPPG
jgi:NDP-sugar pyrophosphorylase family protein